MPRSTTHKEINDLPPAFWKDKSHTVSRPLICSALSSWHVRLLTRNYTPMSFAAGMTQVMLSPMKQGQDAQRHLLTTQALLACIPTLPLWPPGFTPANKGSVLNTTTRRWGRAELPAAGPFPDNYGHVWQEHMVSSPPCPEACATAAQALPCPASTAQLRYHSSSPKWCAIPD